MSIKSDSISDISIFKPEDVKYLTEIIMDCFYDSNLDQTISEYIIETPKVLMLEKVKSEIEEFCGF